MMPVVCRLLWVVFGDGCSLSGARCLLCVVCCLVCWRMLLVAVVCLVFVASCSLCAD